MASSSVTLLNDMVEQILYGDPGYAAELAQEAEVFERKDAAEMAQVRVMGMAYGDAEEKKALELSIELLSNQETAAKVATTSKKSSGFGMKEGILLGGGLLAAFLFLGRKKK